MEDEEIIIKIFKDYIRQFEKSNTISVGMLPNGENVIYTKIKMTGRQKEFMKDYIERKEKIKMELEIEEKLQLKYKNLIVEVNYKDIRKYEIVIKLEYKGVTYESKFEYLYNAKLTLDANISIIENIIDSKIILSFYKKGE